MSQIDNQTQALSTLLQLEKITRQADNLERLAFLIVNESHQLFHYHQAVFWQPQRAKAKILAISGLAQLENNAPFIRWLTQVLEQKCLPQLAESTAPFVLKPAQLSEVLKLGWREYTPGHVLVCPLVDPRVKPAQKKSINSAKPVLAGLWLTRDSAWSEPEIALLSHLAEAYGHSLAALSPPQKHLAEGVARFLRSSLVRLLLLASLIGAAFIPVRQNVLAPGSVIPLDPIIVSAPQDGVVKEIQIEPNSAVQINQPLFRLDDTQVRNRLAVARKALAVSEAEYLKAAQKAFADIKSKGETASLKARVEQTRAEVDYYAELLDRLQVKAEKAAVALFNDANDWVGRPVALGEKVMTLADPDRMLLDIQLPVADAINLEPGAEVRLYLNTDPTHSLEARLVQTSYEAEVNEEGILAFPLKAEFTTQKPPRIGLKGTAKVYGQEVSLFYFIFRRPIAVVRQWLGL